MGLVGIYSFPKSGNTWIKAILANAMGIGTKDIPNLHDRPLSDASSFKGSRFFKLHAGRNVKRWRGQKIDATHIIHIRRNPLDVFMSYMNYISANVTGSATIPFANVDDIRDTELFDLYFHTFVTTGHLSVTFAATTKSYFAHNLYWISQREVPTTLLKYEDLKQDPLRTLLPLCPVLDIDESALKPALEEASAATKPTGKFFWKQKEKNFLDYLGNDQIELFLKYRAEDCIKLGYEPDYFRR